MARLEDLTKGALARGVLADRAVKVVDVDWHGSNAITPTFTDESTGKPGQELLYRDDEPALSSSRAGRPGRCMQTARSFALASTDLMRRIGE
jgi:hypothetical protein